MSKGRKKSDRRGALPWTKAKSLSCRQAPSTAVAPSALGASPCGARSSPRSTRSLSFSDFLPPQLFPHFYFQFSCFSRETEEEGNEMPAGSSEGARSHKSENGMRPRQGERAPLFVGQRSCLSYTPRQKAKPQGNVTSAQQLVCVILRSELR